MLITISAAAVLIVAEGAVFFMLLTPSLTGQARIVAQYVVGSCFGGFLSLVIATAAYPTIRLQIQTVERLIRGLGLQQLAGAWTRFMHGIGMLGEVIVVGIAIGCSVVWSIRKHAKSHQR